MATSSITTQLPHGIEDVWRTVTSLDHQDWRSDLGKLEAGKEEKNFIEYTSGGFPTEFTITVFEPMKKYGFNMENSHMKGDWIGIFSGDADHTTIHFTEHVHAKHMLLKPFVRIYLRKQQKRYIEDLRRELQLHPGKTTASE